MNLGTALRIVTGIGLSMVIFDSASASYVGESFLHVPGLTDETKNGAYDSWARFEAFYWEGDEPGQSRKLGRRDKDLRYTVPVARSGPGQLVAAMDKRNPLLRKFLQSCKAKAAFPEIKFAVSADRSRHLGEIGWIRPREVPEYFEYRLRNAQLVDCPIVAGAPDQALVIKYDDVALLNYAGDPQGPAAEFPPVELPLLPVSGAARTFVVSWFGYANDVDGQCERYNKPPSEDDYYALVPREKADKERAERTKTGGVSYQDGTMEFRGPNRLNAVRLPGIVPDPGQIEPKGGIARGVDLDGHDGKGRAPAGICEHENFRSEDGRTGIDNQLYRVMGCATGYQGHKGYLMQYSNEQRRNGLQQMLIHITGVNDEQNDAEVQITILYSNDPMAKAVDGKRFLADYTYSLSKTPALTHQQTTVSGRIVDGVISASRAEPIRMHEWNGFVTFNNPALHLKFEHDGSLKGVIGGYVDWHRLLMLSGASSREYNHGLQIPAWYNALKRYADGLKDPKTGQCHGISTAYDIEAVPAFLPPAQQRSLVARLKK